MNRLTPLLAAAWLACGAAQAQTTRNTVDVGLVYTYTGDSTVESYSGAGVPTGASLATGNATSLLLAYEFYATPAIGLQLTAAVGGTLDINAAGSIAATGNLGSTKFASGTLFVNFHFFDESNALRPFIGLGINYTRFYDPAVVQLQGLSLTDTWSPAAQAGVRYAIDRNWSVVGTLGMNWMRSDISMSDANGSQQASVKFRPVVATLGIGYSF